MLVVLGIRTAISVLAIIGDAWGGRLLSLILGTIFAVLGFFFIAWCLAVIGDAQGYRKVFGFNVVSTVLGVGLFEFGGDFLQRLEQN